jgi:hypothetical protein
MSVVIFHPLAVLIQSKTITILLRFVSNGSQFCCDDGAIQRRNLTRTRASSVFQHGNGKYGKWPNCTSSRLVMYNQRARELSGRRTMAV